MAKAKYEVGQVLEANDGDLGIVIEADKKDAQVIWLPEDDAFSLLSTNNRYELQPIDPRNPPEVHSRLLAAISAYSKISHVFVVMWPDDGVPNCNVFGDLPELVTTTRFREHDALKAIANPGEPIQRDNMTLRFVLKE